MTRGGIATAALIASLVLAIGNAQVCSADDDDDDASADTNTPLAPQLCNQWCWAATVEMVSAQLGKRVSQCQVVSVRYGTGNSCCAPNACGTICNLGSGGPDILTRALQFWGIHGQYQQGALTGAELRDALDQGSPIIAATFPHAFVVSGYSRKGHHFVYHVLDPYTGESDESYPQLKNHGGYRWVYSWWAFR